MGRHCNGIANHQLIKSEWCCRVVTGATHQVHWYQLTAKRYGSDFKGIMFNLSIQNCSFGTRTEIALRWMTHNPTNEKPILVHPWGRQVTGHYRASYHVSPAQSASRDTVRHRINVPDYPCRHYNPEIVIFLFFKLGWNTLRAKLLDKIYHGYHSSWNMCIMDRKTIGPFFYSGSPFC